MKSTVMLNGNLVVAQSGGPTAVINASLAGVVRAIRRVPQVHRVFGLVHGIEGALNDWLVDLTALSDEVLMNLAKTPASALGSCRRKLTDLDYERILHVFKSYDVRHFVYIGGNDSMDTCQQVASLAVASGYELQVIGVPKTIDNDLAETDHCPGYGSAARFVVLATRDTGLDLEAMVTFDDVTILEVMGRDAGWLAAAAFLAKENPEAAPHLVYLPEIPFDEDRFLSQVAAVHARLNRVFVVVSEGLRTADGAYVGAGRQKRRDSFGHTLPTLSGGVAQYLAGRVRGLRLQARFLRPVLIGRSFSACISTIDLQEAYRAGEAAVELLAAGQSRLMVTLDRATVNPYSCVTGAVSLHRVANAVKKVPLDWIDADGTKIDPKFYEYAAPLIGEPLPPITRLRDLPRPARRRGEN